MLGTYRLMRVFGLDINVHWSWIFIFVLVTWTFATGVLEEFYPEWTDSRAWVVGAAISILFFLCILAHEMSHSLLARRYGIPVSSITLFVFGGVSSLTKEPENSRQEFWIAFVGPLTSFAIAIVFGVAFLLLRNVDEGAAAVSANLAAINTGIGIFNLVPGFPLDGGRMLRAAFWARERNILTATRMASNLGVFTAYVIMAAGVAAFIFVSVLSGVWLFLIGNFLRSASSASYEQLFMDRVLKGVPASTLASRDFVTVSPETTLSQLTEEHVLAGHGRCFPIVAGDELLGLITLTDLREVPRDAWPTTTVYRAMTPFEKLRTVSLTDDLPTVLTLMATSDINQVPLVDGRVILGLIHRADVIRYIQVRQEIGTGASTY
ncbi:MAG TPA: site-2 protease family protein [Dehalococcoidia bacterium]|nr:site-2 protease family protein [Dehalococcoidia bacterium]